MKGGRLGALSVLLLAPAGASCDFDFTDLPGSQPARLTVWLEVLSAEDSVFEMRGGFSPGRDGRGVLRTIEDDQLTILGQSFLPSGTTSQGGLTYEEKWVLPSTEEPGPMELRGPRVEGITDPPPPLGFRLCRGEALELDRLTPTDTLQFNISCPFHDPDFKADWLEWELRVTSSEEGSPILVRLRGSVGPPTEITLPADWIPMNEGPAIFVEMDVRENLVREDLAIEYNVSMTVRSRMRWRLEWE